MDSLPLLSSKEYFEQRSACLPHSAPSHSTYLTFETSRGCWWGQKHHCTFCGLNGEGMGYRRKSPGRVISELQALLEDSLTNNVSNDKQISCLMNISGTSCRSCTTDFLIFTSFTSKNPICRSRTSDPSKAAGISTIQPGIEALSSRLLKLMRKGVNARQNLMLLRYGRTRRGATDL